MRVARALNNLPLIRGAFASGSLSYSKVRALTRVAEPEMEPELLELAGEATASQLEGLLRGYRKATADDDATAAERRHLATRWEDDGTLTIRGSLPADEGALLLKALELAREQLRGERILDAEADGRSKADPPAPDNADAVVALAETVIERGVRAASGGDRHQVVFHVDLAAAATSQRCGRRGIDDAQVEGVPLSAATAGRIACDASVVTMVERDGEPLSVGRKTRTIPPAIRRALATRDRCCRFPGCDRHRFVDAHHIHHWMDGGETALDNLVLLCRHHHRLLHEGGFTLTGGAVDPRFSRRDGSLIEAAPALPEGSAATLASRFPIEHPPKHAAGESMDLDLAVFALADLHERRLASA